MYQLFHPPNKKKVSLMYGLVGGRGTLFHGRRVEQLAFLLALKDSQDQ